MSIISGAPYYDKYDRSKKYTHLLAVPGRVAQARELTEMQSTLKDIIKSIGDSFMDDGNIIEGCKVSPDIATLSVTVDAGRVYMQGMVYEIGLTKVDMTASGREVVGVRLKESVVYATDDPDLKDPALGFENYNQSGCDRLKSELEVVVVPESEVNDSIAKLAVLVDGVQVVIQQAPNYSALQTTLARRTYDESGSYIVEGLEVHAQTNADENLYDIVVEKGKAYVHGFELEISSSITLSMPRALTSASTEARYSFSRGSTYLLTTGPYVKNISRVVAALEKTESVTINNSNGATLSQNSAYKIISVTKGDKNYTPSGEGTEAPYRLEQSQGLSAYIKWENTDYPGDNVVVTYYYTHEFQEGVDYELYYDESRDRHTMRWIQSSPNIPVVGERLDIQYEKYLARKDTVYMDDDGEIKVKQGIPADYGMEVAPTIPTHALSLATIKSPPGGFIDSTHESTHITVSNVGLTRFTMSDIHRLLNRVRTLEYDQTILSLNTEAKEYAVDDKRGIFTDPFVDLSKLDLLFNLDSLGNNIREDIPVFSSAIDLESNMIHLTLNSSFLDSSYNEDLSTSNRYNRVATLKKKGERVVLAQERATKSFLIAPYLSLPQVPEVFIDPSLDTWYDTSYVEVQESISKSKVVSSSTNQVHLTNYDPSWHDNMNVYRTTTSTATKYTATGSTVDVLVEEDVISEKSVTYIRPREITVTGSNYPPNLDNIKCYFEGVEAPMTPIGSTLRGTNPGSVKSNSSGSFTAKFTIPSKIRTGTRVVTFSSPLTIDGYESSAFTFYQATGIARTIRRTITTITTVLQHRVDTVTTTKTFYDPLAQTFVLDRMTLLNSVDIYFESVPTVSSLTPVTCEIREVSDGNIKSTVYGFKTVKAMDIKPYVSSDGRTPFRFTFNDPVLIEANKEYAIVLRSTSQDYRVFVAEIGEEDIVSKERVVSNPYLQGVMMSSSNNSSWTSHQKTDLKFRLIADTYENRAEINFGKITSDPGFCRIRQAAESIIFEGTSIDWYYSLDETNYKEMSLYTPIALDSLNHTYSLRAVLSKEDDVDLTPIVALDSVSVSLESYENSEDGYYISKLITGLDEFSEIDVIVDTREPDGTSLEVFISSNENNDYPYYMHPISNIVDQKELNHGWVQKTYRATIEPATQCRLFIKLHSNYTYRTPAFRRLRAIMS